jgi:uncharacterized protein (TIGR02246 family)
MNQDEEAIREVIARWHRATADGDVDTVLGLMAEDVVFLVPGKPPLRGRASFEKGLRDLCKSVRIESRGNVQEIQVSQGLAYCWTLLTVRMTPIAGGKATERSGSSLSIFRKQTNGSWRLVRDANLLPPPNSA